MSEKNISMQLKSVDANGKSKTKTITSVNPAVDDADIASAADKINALSENTPKGAIRVEKSVLN